MNNENWKQYQDNMYDYTNDCIAKNDDSYSAIAKDEHILKTFFDIYENTEQNEELIAQVNDSKTRSNQAPITVGQLITQLPTNTPLADEVNAIRAEEKLEQVQKQKDGIQTRDAEVAKYFNINIGRQYALDRAENPFSAKYGYLGSEDCTNFASQILHEGGMPLCWGGEGWWYTSGRYFDYSTSWINANKFCGFWFGIDYTTTSLFEFSGILREGDFIAIDYSLDWSYDHVGFVAWLGTYGWHTNGYGHDQRYRDFVVAQHSKNYALWVSDNNNGWDDVEGIDTDSTRNGRYARVWTR